MKNFLDEVSPQHYFVMKNGFLVRSLPELYSVVSQIDNDVFHHHLNSEKNDFASWIDNVIGDDFLKNKLLEIDTKDQFLRILNSRIHQLRTNESDVKDGFLPEEDVQFDVPNEEDILKNMIGKESMSNMSIAEAETVQQEKPKAERVKKDSLEERDVTVDLPTELPLDLPPDMPPEIPDEKKLDEKSEEEKSDDEKEKSKEEKKEEEKPEDNEEEVQEEKKEKELEEKNEENQGDVKEEQKPEEDKKGEQKSDEKLPEQESKEEEQVENLETESQEQENQQEQNSEQSGEDQQQEQDSEENNENLEEESKESENQQEEQPQKSKLQENLIELREITLVPLGLKELDTLFPKGIPKICNMMFMGIMSTGKTLTALNLILEKAKQGEKVLYISFHDSEEKIINIMKTLDSEILDYVNSGNIMIKKLNPFEIIHDFTNKDATQKFSMSCKYLEFIEVFGPQLVVVDSLSTLELTFGQNKIDYRHYVDRMYKYFEKMGLLGIFIQELKSDSEINKEFYENLLSDIIVYFSRSEKNKKSDLKVIKEYPIPEEAKIEQKSKKQKRTNLKIVFYCFLYLFYFS